MKSLIVQVDKTLVSLAWRLWNTLGVAGDGSQEQNWFIALEELIILTAVVAESDPRLRDEAIDWCSKFHHFVSINRLRTLVIELGEQVHIPFSIFAETLNSVSRSKWPTFAKVKPLHIACSKKSQEPDCAIPALLGLRMRALFGVGARADLTTHFLTSTLESFTAADMSEIGYSKRTLADALDSFVGSGLLTSSMSRNQKKYELAKREQLSSLAGELPKVIPDWRGLLTVLVTLRTILRQQQEKSPSSQIVSVRNALGLLTKELQSLNLAPPELPSDTSLYWDRFVEWIDKTTKAIATRGDLRKMSTLHKNSEEALDALIQDLYRVDDCVDGLELLIAYSRENPPKHQQIFTQCYQTGLCYLNELKPSLDSLLKFPIHLLMDISLSEAIYKYSKEDWNVFLSFIEQLPRSSSITQSTTVLNWYKNLESQLNKIHRLIYEIKERLKQLYFRKTNDHLLLNSPVLYKRHAVMDLFSEK